MFIDINSGKQINASASKSIEWASWTCKIGWPVQGIFKTVDYTDVNTVHRAANKRIMVTGDDDGYVNLYKYPSVQERSNSKSYIAHSSHVTRTRFLFDDTKVISVGGNDKCVLVWKTDFGAGDEGKNAIQDENEQIEDDGVEDDEDYVKNKSKKDKYDRKPTVAAGGAGNADANMGGDFF